MRKTTHNVVRQSQDENTKASLVEYFESIGADTLLMRYIKKNIDTLSITGLSQTPKHTHGPYKLSISIGHLAIEIVSHHQEGGDVLLLQSASVEKGGCPILKGKWNAEQEGMIFCLGHYSYLKKAILDLFHRHRMVILGLNTEAKHTFFGTSARQERAC